MGGILVAIGGLMALIGGIWIIVLAFKKSILWGIFSLLISPVAIIFALMHLSETGKPLLIWVGGIILMGVGTFMFGG